MHRITTALIRRNAESCETAKHDKCTCACGGELHGQKHNDAWIEAMLREFGFHDCAQADLFDNDNDDKAPSP